MSFFRYPGGKAKLSGPILSKIQELTEGQDIHHYMEPFFGGGSICFATLKKKTFPDLKSVVINEADFALYCLWHTVIRDPEALIKKVREFKPSTQGFYAIKESLIRGDYQNLPYETIGLMKLAIHQMSYSGLGVKAGGPIGGSKQMSKYGVDCRWSPDSIIKKINVCYDLLSEVDVRMYVGDAINVIDYCSTPDTFIYLDPPYYEKGQELYQFTFLEDAHKQLADTLKKTPSPWLLSYDDCPEVRELYSWATIEDINVNYTITTARTKSELLIYPKK